MSTDFETLSPLIGLIYDTVLDPDRWPAVLNELCQLFNSLAGTLNFHEMIERRGLLTAEFGTDPAYSQLYVERYAQMNPVVPAAFHYCEIGKAYRTRDLVDAAEWNESRIYREWAVPQGYNDVMFVVAHRDDRHLGLLALTRSEPYRESELRLLELITSHVQRALTLGNHFQQRKVEATLLMSLVDQITAGLVLVDHEGRVLLNNEAAQKLLRDEHLQRDDGKLNLSSLPLPRLLETVRSQGAFVGTANARGGETLSVTAFPLAGAASVPSIAIFITSAETSRQPPGALLAAAFNLTAGELRVLLALMEGLSPADIADRFGLSVPTVRSHLHRLFQKTETSAQAELIAKATKLFPSFAPNVN